MMTTKGSYTLPQMFRDFLNAFSKRASIPSDLLEGPDHFRYPDLPGTGRCTAVTTRAVTNKGIVLSYFLSDRELHEEFLRIDILIQDR